MEHATFEQAVEVVNSLPTDDRERFSEWFKKQERLDTKANDATAMEITQPPRSTLETREARFQRALQWIEKNKAEYRKPDHFHCRKILTYRSKNLLPIHSPHSHRNTLIATAYTINPHTVSTPNCFRHPSRCAPSKATLRNASFTEVSGKISTSH